MTNKPSWPIFFFCDHFLKPSVKMYLSIFYRFRYGAVNTNNYRVAKFTQLLSSSKKSRFSIYLNNNISRFPEEVPQF